MKLRVPSPFEVAKRVYNASRKAVDLSNTFGYETRAAEAGDSRTAKGHILTRTTARKNDSALAALLKNPTLALMIVDILSKGSDALKKLTESLTTASQTSSALPAASVTPSTQGTGFGDAVSRAMDTLLTKMGLLSEPEIQANGTFMRDQFHFKTTEVSKDAVQFIKAQTDHAAIFAQQVVNDTFHGPHLPPMQTKVEALQNGELDDISFATAHLKTNSGIYRFGDNNYAITSDLAKRLNAQFGTSADTVKVDAVVAFRRATPTAPEPIQIAPAPVLSPSFR